MYQPSEQLVCPFCCIVLEPAASIATNNKQAQTTTNANNTRFLLTTPANFKLAYLPKPDFINALLNLHILRERSWQSCVTALFQMLRDLHSSFEIGFQIRTQLQALVDVLPGFGFFALHHQREPAIAVSFSNRRIKIERGVEIMYG